MSGGRIAQLGFYHQNIYFIYCLLEKLQCTPNLQGAKIEQKITATKRNGPELDFIFHYAGQNKYDEYYEIKSGRVFTDCESDIIKTLKKLYLVFKENERSNCYIVVDMSYKRKIADYIHEIETIKVSTIDGSYLKTIIKKCEFNASEKEKIFEFCMRLFIIPIENISLYETKMICILNKLIGTVPSGGVEAEGLIANIYHYLIKTLETDGTIDISEVISMITAWMTKNLFILNLQSGNDFLTIGNQCWSNAKLKISTGFETNFCPQENHNPFSAYIARGEGNENS